MIHHVAGVLAASSRRSRRATAAPGAAFASINLEIAEHARAAERERTSEDRERAGAPAAA
jgi:hypothetical protein